MDTGLGKDGYSIISQGKVDEILSNKSEERRHIFEEAAGIVKYRTRKEEAQRKLENTETTLTRVGDVIAEIENNIEPLQKRAETAKEYLKLRDELKLLDVKLFINAVDNNSSNIEQIDDMLNTLGQDIEKQETLSRENEDKKIELKAKIADLSSKIEELREKFFQVENEKEKLNSKISLLEANINASTVNSLPPAAKPNPTLDTGIISVPSTVSIGSPIIVFTSTISFMLSIALFISPSIGCVSFIFSHSLSIIFYLHIL
jgi:chromosome segregation protein